jgi:AbiJ N-terminal domain 3/Abortive infection C-terminus
MSTSFPPPSVISDVTRRNMFDAVTLSGVHWSGRLPEDDFLGRIYNLKQMPSTDHRFNDAGSDIWQHCVRNTDWEPDWVFNDSRFNLMWCGDEELLKFRAEMLHPMVRAEPDEVERLLAIFNQHLAVDGWELYAATTVSGRPVFAGRKRMAHLDHAVSAVKNAIEPMGAEYINQQITRMYAAAQSDPELAIGTAKELLETVCKCILVDRTGTCDPALDLPALIKRTTKELQLAPEDVLASAKGAESLRILLNNLGSIAGRLAELRNLYGTGHGKDPSLRGLDAKHARLAVGAAATLAAFLMETHQA